MTARSSFQWTSPTALLGVSTVSVLVAHVALRQFTWTHEWLLTTWQYAFATLMLTPIVAGFSVWNTSTIARTFGAPSRAAGRVYAVVVRSAIETAGPSIAIFAVGYVAVMAITATMNNPGPLSIGDVMPIGPALAQLACAALLGSAFGWRFPSVVTAPVVAVSLFVCGVVGYGTPLSFLFDTGGASGSLVGLEANTQRTLLQIVVFATIAALAPAIVARDIATARHRSYTLGAGIVVLIAVVSVAAYVNPSRLVANADDELSCATAPEPGAPEVCLGPGYRERSVVMSAALAEPTSKLQSIGVTSPAAYRQSAHVGGDGIATIDSTMLDQGPDAPAQALVYGLVPPGCEFYNSDSLLEAYRGLSWWLAPQEARDVLLPSDSVPQALLGSDADQKRWAADAASGLMSCAL